MNAVIVSGFIAVTGALVYVIMLLFLQLTGAKKQVKKTREVNQQLVDLAQLEKEAEEFSEEDFTPECEFSASDRKFTAKGGEVPLGEKTAEVKA